MFVSTLCDCGLLSGARTTELAHSLHAAAVWPGGHPTARYSLLLPGRLTAWSLVI